MEQGTGLGKDYASIMRKKLRSIISSLRTAPDVRKESKPVKEDIFEWMR